jgi:hypothetical protein
MTGASVMVDVNHCATEISRVTTRRALQQKLKRRKNYE